MARPRIFISSTFYDLKYIREDIGRFVKELGYDPILFEKGEIPYGKNQKPEEYCYKEIELSDVLISIIGGRHGSESIESGYSVTQKELRQALEIGKQVYIFVEKNIEAEFETYKINKTNKEIKYKHVDNIKVYEFLEEIHDLPRNNPIFSFESSQDIVRILKEQWAGLFQRLLSREEDGKQLEIINSLKSTMNTLQNIVKVMSEKSEIQSTVIDEIIMFNHPVFFHVQNLFNVKYRIAFTNYREFTVLLEEFGYTQRLDDDPFTDFETWSYRNQNTEYTLKFSKGLFDGNGNLLPANEVWSSDLVQLQETEVGPVFEVSDDDLPF